VTIARLLQRNTLQNVAKVPERDFPQARRIQFFFI
jgi:hypothetical protein